MTDDFTPEAILKKLTSSADCIQFAINIAAKYPETALKAKRRAVELQAQEFGAPTEVERDALVVIYAYEAVLTDRNRKKTRATRTWQMIERYGIVPAIERVVNREVDAAGFKALAEMGMGDLTFEALVLRHPNSFSPEAVEHCRKRLEEDSKK